jgi:Holliday junction resolvase
MVNNEYRRGDTFEKRVMAELTADGYACWQTRGSKSPADIVAIKPGETLLVQAKSGRTRPSHAEWNALHDLAARVGAVPLVATRHADGPHGAMVTEYVHLIGAHWLHAHEWPSERWYPDRVGQT